MEENSITVDKAVQTIKGAIFRAQAQASQSSNAIQLSLYYGIGRYVSINLQQAHWGAKALDSISERLQCELPGLRGFVLCKEMNKAFVDIVVRNYDSPMGVATYKTKQDMPEELQKALPDLDKMKDLYCKSL